MAQVQIANDPVRFESHMENCEADEAETDAELVKVMRKIQDTTYADSGKALRSVHAKGHALLAAEFAVLPNLPHELAQGLFARPARYKCVMRYSTIPGDILDDSISVPRGLAIKVFGVEGHRLDPNDDGLTQDFVLGNGPVFSAPDPKAFLKSLKLLAATTDQPQFLKKAASSVARSVEAVVEAFGGESPLLKTLGGNPSTNPLGDAFYSQAPILFGDYIAKLGLFPLSESLVAHKDKSVATTGRPDALREEIGDHFARGGGRWEVRAQLCRDLSRMPIEDASIPWSEDVSPYLPVAHIEAGLQSTWSEERQRLVDDCLSFSPWHGLAAHRPLGAIMRARRSVYEAAARFRFEHHGCPYMERQSAPDM